MYIIDFYEDKDGYSDFQTYLEKLLISHDQTDRMVLKKMRYQMKLLENLGPALRMPQVKELKGYTSKLFELRPLPERVFFSFSGKDRSSSCPTIQNVKTAQIRGKSSAHSRGLRIG